MQEIQAPYPFLTAALFLAGSIGMGQAQEWQTIALHLLHELDGAVLNPRRRDWDASWVPSKDNPQFRQQVEWELHGLEVADAILMCFDPRTQSPITLLELGLCVAKPLFVICPDGFWRKGNVDIVCGRYRHVVFDTLEDGIAAYKQWRSTQ